MRNIFETVVLSAALLGNAQPAETQPLETQPAETSSTSSSSSETNKFQTTQTSSPMFASDRYRWTGFYAGVNFGGGFGDSNITTTGQAAANVNNVNGGARPAAVTLGRSGLVGGGQVGYNHQFGRFVAGLEADLDGSGISGQRTVVTTALTGGASLNNNFGNDLKYIGTVRGRVGFAFDRTLVYGTGGLAYGSSDHTAGFFGASPANVLQFTGSSSQIKSGYVAGGGVEQGLSRRLSVKAEYLKYDLGTDLVNVAVIAGSGGGGTGYNSNFANKGSLARVGVNFRF